MKNEMNNNLLRIKMFFVVMFLLIVPLLNVGTAMATIVARNPVPAQQDFSVVSSADQYYSVLFDGEGEAMVSLRLTLKNSDDASIDKFNLEIPGNRITILGVLQEVRYYDYSGEYKKINVHPEQLSNAVVVPIDLISSIDKDQQSNFLIVYKVNGDANNFFGTYKFNFETAKVNFMTTNLRVAVNVQENLYLEGTGSNVNYLPNFGGLSKSMASMDNVEMMQQAQPGIRDYANRITYQQGYVKSASYLDASESLTVKGKYASSRFALYWPTYLLVTIILGIVVYGVILYRKKHPRRKTVNVSVASRKDARDAHLESRTGVDEDFKISRPVLWGLSTVVLLAIFWTVVILFSSFASSMFDYSVRQLFQFVLILFAILVSLGAIIGTPFYVMHRYGGKTGVLTAVSIIVWIFLVALIVLASIGLLSRPVIYY